MTTSPSLRQMLGDVSQDLKALVRQTAALARAEVGQAARGLMWSAIGLIVSLVVALSGVAVLVAALVLVAIALGLPAWAAAGLVGVILVGAGGLAARHFAMDAAGLHLTLPETRHSLSETAAWLKAQADR